MPDIGAADLTAIEAGSGEALAGTAADSLLFASFAGFAAPAAVAVCAIAHGCWLFDRPAAPELLNRSDISIETELDSWSAIRPDGSGQFSTLPAGPPIALRGRAFAYTPSVIYVPSPNDQCNGGYATPSAPWTEFNVVMFSNEQCVQKPPCPPTGCPNISATRSFFAIDTTPTAQFSTSDTPPANYQRSPNPWPSANPTTTARLFSQWLGQQPESTQQRVVNELGHQIDPTDYSNPYTSYASVPDCSDVLYADCLTRLHDRGFTNVTRTNASFDDADTSKPADAVLSVSPTAGSVTTTDTEVTVRANPPTDQMPVVVPDFAPAPGEDADAYIQKLSDLGLQAQQVTSDDGFDPGNVDRTDPQPGTRMLPGAPVKVDQTTERRCPEPDATKQDADETRGWKVNGKWQTRQYELAPEPNTFTDDVGGEVQLRWGATLPPEWPGWGYRHIAAKHGWTADDISSTATTLAHPVVKKQQLDDDIHWGWSYLGQAHQVGDYVCARYVLVGDTVTGPDELDDGTQEPKGIITSYEKLIEGPNDPESRDPNL